MRPSGPLVAHDFVDKRSDVSTSVQCRVCMCQAPQRGVNHEGQRYSHKRVKSFPLGSIREGFLEIEAWRLRLERWGGKIQCSHVSGALSFSKSVREATQKGRQGQYWQGKKQRPREAEPLAQDCIGVCVRTQMLACQLGALCISSRSMFLPQGWSGIGPQVGLGNSHSGSRSSLGASRSGCSASPIEHVFPVFLPPPA